MSPLVNRQNERCGGKGGSSCSSRRINMRYGQTCAKRPGNGVSLWQRVSREWICAKGSRGAVRTEASITPLATLANRVIRRSRCGASEIAIICLGASPSARHWPGNWANLSLQPSCLTLLVASKPTHDSVKITSTSFESRQVLDRVKEQSAKASLKAITLRSHLFSCIDRNLKEIVSLSLSSL